MGFSDPPVSEPPLTPPGAGNTDRGHSSRGFWLLRLGIVVAVGIISGYTCGAFSVTPRAAKALSFQAQQHAGRGVAKGMLGDDIQQTWRWRLVF